MWHALLSLMTRALHLCTASKFVSNDPLVVAALSYLPCITILGSDCLWPASFATFIDQRDESTGRYRYLALREVRVGHHDTCPPADATLELVDDAPDGRLGGPVFLRPLPYLFPAYNSSLSDEQQATLARWAAGNFQAGDEALDAAETERVQCEERKVNDYDPDRLHRCPHPHLFNTRWINEQDEVEDVSDDMVNVNGAGSMAGK